MKTYSPIRKRTRKEPLRISNQPATTISLKDTSLTDIETSNLNKEPLINKVLDASIEKESTTIPKKQEKRNEKQPIPKKSVIESWNLEGQNIATMSPSCVDVSKLCDFINGSDSQIDTWFAEDDSTAPQQTQEREVKQECKETISTREITHCVNFEETLAHVNEILYGPHELKSTLCRNYVDSNKPEDVPKNVDSDQVLTKPYKNELHNLSSSSPRHSTPKVNSEDDSNDWLKEFENDEFWGEQKRDDTTDVTFDLDVVQLFCFGEE